MVVATDVPLLMLAEKAESPENREFIDVSTGSTHSMDLPELAGKCCLGVGYPDPLSSPTDFVLALIQGSPPTFAVWRAGDTSFTSLGAKTIPDCAYSDITWHDGNFYGPNFRGDIIIFSGDPNPGPRVVKGMPLHLIGSCQLYIVYSMGELLVIHRDGPISDEGQDKNQYGVKTFHVYKINDIDSTSYSYEEIKDLGDRALFVGRSATLAIEDDRCKKNHIYFTDDCLDGYFGLQQDGGKDMGVYDLLDGIILPHYTGQSFHKVTPPLWV